MAIFFTSDTHFNHLSVIGFCSRPFGSLDEMNDHLVMAWNDTVRPQDDVWHLGDFCWFEREAEAFFSRLNGKKRLIVGNHDHRKARRLPWVSVNYAHKLRAEGKAIYLSHYPVVGFREEFHFHGHQHNRTPCRLPRQVDVGVDAWGMRPVSLHAAIAAAEAFEKGPEA